MKKYVIAAVVLNLIFIGRYIFSFWPSVQFKTDYSQNVSSVKNDNQFSKIEFPNQSIDDTPGDKAILNQISFERGLINV